MLNRNVVGLGLVGYGGFGRFLRTAWEPLDVVKLRAVSDLRTVVDAGDVEFRRRWQDLIVDPAIELIAIATPPSTHAEIACAAMRAGKHVLIEKPLATTRDDAARIRRIRDETGRVAGVDYMLRFNPIVEAVHAWARGFAFGPLRRVIIENYAQDEQLPAHHWFWDESVSGGILVEHAVHFIDLVNACTSHPPATVSGHAVRRDDNRTDRMLLTVVYSDGLVLSQYHAFSRPGFFEETTMRFVFDIAQVETRGWIPLEGNVVALVNDQTEQSLHILPNLEVNRRMPVKRIEDVSRPVPGNEHRDARDRDTIRSGGIEYDVTEQIEARFHLGVSKSEGYATALRALMSDVAASIRFPQHTLRVTLADAISSLEIALSATEAANLHIAQTSGRT